MWPFYFQLNLFEGKSLYIPIYPVVHICDVAWWILEAGRSKIKRFSTTNEMSKLYQKL